MTNWDGWQYFLGEWISEGIGEAGECSGEFNFYFDFQAQILVRKNFAEYPAREGKPAYRHDDLMVIYRDAEESFRATYRDNEGQVIQYTAEFSADKSALTFISDIQPSAPRFRLAYKKMGNDLLSIKFEIAPPGKPDEFAPYLEAAAQRKIHQSFRRLN